MADPLVIVGAGGFGRETIDVVRAINASGEDSIWRLLGVVDDAPSQLNLSRLEALGVKYLGNLDRLREMADVVVVIAVGSPKVRSAISDRLDMWGLKSPNLLHPDSVVGSQFSGSDGLIACAQVSVGTNVTIGRHTHLNPHAVMGHDTVVGNFVSVNPNATVSGDCKIEDEVLIGAAALVLQGLTVRRAALVGGGACVTRDVAAGAIVKGVPAR